MADPRDAGEGMSRGLLLRELAERSGTFLNGPFDAISSLLGHEQLALMFEGPPTVPEFEHA